MNERALEAVRHRYLPATRGVVRFIQFFSRARARLFGFVFGLATDGVTAFTTESSGAEVRPLATLGVTLLTYRYWVAPTIVGHYLSGRRRFRVEN